MNPFAAKLAVLATILLLLAGTGNSQVSGSAPGNSPTVSDKPAVSVSDGASLSVTLVGSLDAKKNKAGDSIEARTTQDLQQGGKTVIPKDTRLTGHVTQAQPREKGQPQSALAILFDRTSLPDGTQLQVRVVLQAISIPQRPPNVFGNNTDNAVQASGIQRGFGGSGAEAAAVNGTQSAVSAKKEAPLPGTLGGLDDKGALIPGSQGVFGMNGTTIDNNTSSATQGSVLVSATHTVHLDSNTQMVLRFSSH